MTTKWLDPALENLEQESQEKVCTDSSADTVKPSLEQLYREHRTYLLSHLKTLVKDAHVAEELLHDTFERLSRMPALAVIKQPRPFLHKVATNIALDYLRKRQRSPETESDEALDSWESSEPEQAEMIQQERQISQLRKTIGALPPKAREALLLAKYKEMTQKEVAAELGVSQTMVEKHLKNALRKCREALTKDLH